MQHAVVIPSTGRPDVVGATVSALAAQSVAPDAIVVCVVDEDDVPGSVRDQARVQVVVAERGSSVQRNAAYQALAEEPDLFTFLDDDIVLRDDYFAQVRGFFAREPDVVLMTGLVVEDGSARGEIARSTALEVLSSTSVEVTQRDVRAAYGCNMTARGRIVRDEPFDERLRLYAWQEDNDFSVRAGRHGRVVHYHGCVCVHLAVGAGRVRGRAFGFAQVVNPYYMWRKGTKTGHELAREWSRYVGSNAAHAVRLRRSDRPDRAGRLMGNLLGFREVVFGGGRPEMVEKVAGAEKVRAE